MIEEVWKSVKGHIEYEASSLGNIRSVDRIDRRGNRISGMPIAFDERGLQIKIKVCRMGKPYYVYVCRFVALAFIDNPKKHAHVIHLNKDPKDNRPENLAWAEEKEDLRGASIIQSKLSWNDVDNIRVLHKSGDTNATIAVRYQVRTETIRRITAGQSWKQENRPLKTF